MKEVLCIRMSTSQHIYYARALLVSNTEDCVIAGDKGGPRRVTEFPDWPILSSTEVDQHLDLLRLIEYIEREDRASFLMSHSMLRSLSGPQPASDAHGGLCKVT